MYDVGLVSTVNTVAIAWLKGDQRKASFTVETSTDGKSWDAVLSGESSGATNDFESYTFSPVSARYVRIVGHGNSVNQWNTIVETEVYGHIDAVPLPIAAARAKTEKKPYVASNTIDSNLKTRWEARGKGQWIQYDTGVSVMVSEVAIAWLKGHQRQASFSIDVSADGKSWTEVFRGTSSGKTKDFESYTFTSTSARYVRIIGYGNTINPWNKITEVELYGYIK